MQCDWKFLLQNYLADSVLYPLPSLAYLCSLELTYALRMESTTNCLHEASRHNNNTRKTCQSDGSKRVASLPHENSAGNNLNMSSYRQRTTSLASTGSCSDSQKPKVSNRIFDSR